VDIISDAGAVFGGVVIAEHTQLCPLADNHLLDVGEEVVRMNKGLISEQVALVCSTGVEVPQGYDLPVLVHLREGIEQHLNASFALSIRTGGVVRVSLLAVILVAVDTCSGRKDKVAALSILLHDFKQV